MSDGEKWCIKNMEIERNGLGLKNNIQELHKQQILYWSLTTVKHRVAAKVKYAEKK